MQILLYREFNDNIVYQDATLEDYQEIKKIANQHREYLPFVMKVSIEESIKRNEVTVAKLNSKVVGFMHFHKRKDDTTTLYEIAVDKDFLRAGIGKKLLSRLQRPIRLKVTVDNPANDFYVRLGFKLVDTIQGRKRKLNLYLL